MAGSLRLGWYPNRDATKDLYWQPSSCYWDGSNWECAEGSEHPPSHESHILPTSAFGPFKPNLKTRAGSFWLHSAAWLTLAAVGVTTVVGILLLGRLGDEISATNGWPFVAVYFLPAFIAAARSVRNLASVVVINVFLGWTLVGWVVALAMAVRTNDELGQAS